MFQSQMISYGRAGTSGTSAHAKVSKRRLKAFKLLEAKRQKPSLTRVYQLLAIVYVCTARFVDALQALAEGFKIDPLWPVLPAVEISVRFFARDFDGAVECGRKSVELHPLRSRWPSLL